MKTILYITTVNPFLQIDGGRILSKSIIDSLPKDASVTLVIIDENRKIPNELGNIDKVLFFKKNNYAVSVLMEFFSNVPSPIYRWYNKSLETFIQKNISSYDIIFVDHLGAFQNVVNAISNKLISKPYVILIEHNLEYRVWEEYYKKSKRWAMNWYINRLISKMKSYEKMAINRSNKVIFISEYEMNSVIQHSWKANKDLQLLPFYVSPKIKFPDPRQEGKKILFTASFKWYPNQDAISWFMENCWNIILDANPEAKFILAGNDPSGFATNISKKYKGVIATGFVDDISKYFLEADLFILPMRIGAGIKIKIFEAMAYGLPIISTTKGVEGLQGILPGKQFALADEPLDFARTIIKLLESREERLTLGMNALNFIKDRQHSFQQCIEEITKSID